MKTLHLWYAFDLEEVIVANNIKDIMFSLC
jgi:hypothetical protein